MPCYQRGRPRDRRLALELCFASDTGLTRLTVLFPDAFRVHETTTQIKLNVRVASVEERDVNRKLPVWSGEAYGELRRSSRLFALEAVRRCRPPGWEVDSQYKPFLVLGEALEP